MFVTKKTEGSILSCGIDFKYNVKTKVDNKTFTYLQDTFGDMFTFDKEVKTKQQKPVKKVTKIDTQETSKKDS